MRGFRSGGCTLVELMVTVAVVAIVSVVAYPNFQSVLRSNRVATASNELVSSLSLARVEALRSPGGAGVCASADGQTCGTDWNAGWMVWVDTNGNGERDTGTPPERIVKYVQGRANASIAESGGQAKFVFDRRGRLTTGSAATISVQPRDACPSGSDFVRQLTLSAAGQVRVAKQNCG